MNNKLQRFISSTVSYHDFQEAVNIAKELNCGIEISRFGRLVDMDEDFEERKKEYKSVLDDFEGDITLHGFFSNLNIAAKDPLIKEVSIKRYNQTLELASLFDVKKVVFHTCLNNLLKQKQYQEMFFLSNIEFFKEFVKNFENLGITIGMENVHEANPDYIRNLIAAVNSPNFRATLDIGHCNLHSDISPSNWIKEYGIMLTHMHFHNNFKDEDSHSSLLNGTLDIKEILKTLRDMQLYPTITFEIFDYEELVESVKYFNGLCDELGIEYC
ncbi:sugar phosphate isomerase/epimerase [bacterium]|nr:sugar phosphate isomerase/epimerase [bacterium]